MVSVPRPRASVASPDGLDVAFDDAAWRRDVRLRALGRGPDGPERASRLRRWAWLGAIAIHVLVVIGLRLALRRHEATPPVDVMQVELLDIPPAPALPEPAPLPERRPLPETRRSSQPRPAPPMVAPAQPPSPAAADAVPDASPPAIDQLRLFNQDGSANVPDDLARQIERARPKPDFIARDYSPSPILQARRPLKVRPNHFAKNWVGTDGKPLHQQFFDSVTMVKEFTAPWGGRYGCAWILILVVCADVPDKPWNPPTTWKPATEQDEY